MPITIKLKLRDRSDSVRVPVQNIAQWMELDSEEAKNAMFRFFSPFAETQPKIHDKVFLETTLNWSPVQMTERGPVSKGTPLTEQMRWYRIAQDLDEIDETKEGLLKLRSKDIKLIVKRWKDPEFKMESIHQRTWISQFLLEFQMTTNEWIDDDLEKDFEDGDENETDPELERVMVSEDGNN